jgi:carboxypeptidase C (cathepsin A)
VGLSYSATPADYSTNDTATAQDSNTFLRHIFKRYPHLQQRDFYITGVWRSPSVYDAASA